MSQGFNRSIKWRNLFVILCLCVMLLSCYVYLFMLWNLFVMEHCSICKQLLLTKKLFIDHQTANAIQLFVPIKRKFFGSLLFQNKLQRRGIPHRLLDKYSHLFICIQPLKFTLAVGNCQGFCWSKQCFHSNHIGKNIAEVIIL